uniref:Uncharacterized protein n=1 Tax=Strongyloides venezuelensis TaxID=75913 RepID=A0A0K0FFP5_STRVS
MPRTPTGSERNFYRYLSTLTHSEQDVLIIRREQVRLHRQIARQIVSEMEDNNELPPLNEQPLDMNVQVPPMTTINNDINDGNVNVNPMNLLNVNGSDQSHSAVNLNHQSPISSHQNNVMHAGVNLNHQGSVSGQLNNGLLEAIQNPQAIVELIQLLQRLVPNNTNATNSSTSHIPLNVNVTNSTSSYGLNKNGLNDTTSQPTITPQTRIPDKQDYQYLPRKCNKPDLFNEEKIFTSWFIKFKIYV